MVANLTRGPTGHSKVNSTLLVYPACIITTLQFPMTYRLTHRMLKWKSVDLYSRSISFIPLKCTELKSDLELSGDQGGSIEHKPQFFRVEKAR